ncbi:uncharacterized protein LOC107854130 [Capsicum annuum]|uniref:uncharacterized protein LOC107854130 n=1 Tax=Capsicum annuum TaxID=4072 RepID=UPI001FB0BFD7|nr:uncharacterized protein LOC107854130 [Capsicum annuum]
MFATKLLKVLETLPTDADDGGCVVSDTPEDKATLKVNQNRILCHLNDDKEANSLVVPTKDLHDSNGYVGSKETLSCDTNDMDKSWEVSELYESVLDNISKTKDDEISVPTVEDDQNETLANRITSRRYGNPFACDKKDIDQQYWNTPELERSMIPDLIDEEENKLSTITGAPHTSGCKLFEADKKSYTEKRLKEYDLPELMVCYKESNYNSIKNIYMEDSWNNAQPGTYVSVPADDQDQHSNTSESADTVSVPAADDDQNSTTSESADTELTSAGGSKSSVEYENNEEKDTESPVPKYLKTTSQDEVNGDSDTATYLEDLIMIFGSSGTAKWKHTNSMLRTEGPSIEKSQQSKHPDQIPFEEVALESQNAVSAVNEASNNRPDTNVFYDSQLGFEAIVVDFNSTKPTSTSKMYQGVENIPEPRNRSFRDLLLDTQGYLADGEASFSALGRQSGRIINSRRISSFGSISDSSTTSSGSFTFPMFCSATSSCASFFYFSGYQRIIVIDIFIILFCYSLESEWNSSPIRMGEVGSGHFRKHRSWKQGILCCRF